jgi:hypothetical protein
MGIRLLLGAMIKLKVVSDNRFRHWRISIIANIRVPRILKVKICLNFDYFYAGASVSRTSLIIAVSI